MEPGTPSTRIVTACFGEAHWRAAPGWTRGLRDLTGLEIDIVSLDGGAHDADGVRTYPWPKADRDYGAQDSERLKHIIQQLGAGRTCIQIDMDVRLKRDIAPLLALPHDLILSRAFGMPKAVSSIQGFVGCMGFFVAKPPARPLMARLLEALDGPGVYDQAVLNTWLAGPGWRRETVTLPPFEGLMDTRTYAGLEVCILPAPAIARNAELEASWFGNHHTSFKPV